MASIVEKIHKIGGSNKPKSEAFHNRVNIFSQWDMGLYSQDKNSAIQSAQEAWQRQSALQPNSFAGTNSSASTTAQPHTYRDAPEQPKGEYTPQSPRAIGSSDSGVSSPERPNYHSTSSSSRCEEYYPPGSQSRNYNRDFPRPTEQPEGEYKPQSPRAIESSDSETPSPERRGSGPPSNTSRQRS